MNIKSTMIGALLLMGTSALSLRKVFSGLTIEQTTNDIFDKFDKDQDGLIENEEFVEFLKDEKSKGVKISDLDEDLGFLAVGKKGGDLTKEDVENFLKKEKIAEEKDEDPIPKKEVAEAVIDNFAEDKEKGLDKKEL